MKLFTDGRGAITLVKDGESSLMQITAAHRRNLLDLISLMDDKKDPTTKVL